MMALTRLGALWREVDQRAGGTTELPLLAVSQLRGVVPRSELTEKPPRAENLSKYKLCEEGDLVINRFNAYRGALGAAPVSGLVSPDYLVLRPGGVAESRYLDYLLRSAPVASHLRRTMGGLGSADPDTSGFSRIDARALNLFKIHLPTRSVQRSVADHLDRETAQIDALIGKQERLIATLRERRIALFAALLAEVPGRPTSINSLAVGGGFHDGDWVESKDQDPAGAIRLLQLADVGDGRFRDRSDRRVNEETFKRLRCSPVQAGDVLIARMPDPLGRACLVPQGLGRSITVVDVAVLRVDQGRFDKRFVVHSLNDHAFRKRLESLQDGATRQRIPRKVLGRQVVNMPPLQAQSRAADALDEKGAQIDELVAKAEQFIALARERRSALITAAVTGQIDVRTAA